MVRGSSSSARSRRLQDILVGSQVTVCLVLMIAGSMAIRSSIRSLAMETGYESKHVVHLDYQFPETSKYTPAHKLALARELRTRLAAQPEVAAITSAKPPGDPGFRTAAIALEGETSSAQNVQSLLYYSYVQANYFQTLGIPLFLGRGFQAASGQPEQSVIVSESAARQLWPGQNPIGRSLRLGLIDERPHSQSELVATGPAYQVIGVARDIRGALFDGSDTKRVYLPMPDDRLAGYSILIRTQSDPAHVMKAIDPVMASIDPNMTARTSTLEDLLRQSAPFIVSSLAAAVASAVGLPGLLLALMGIYGTVSYIVVLRTREIGIRMAIGAQKHHVLRLVLNESTRPVLIGLMAGILLAAAGSYLARGLFYGLNGVDGISFAGASLLFLTIALIASYPPARRAMGVDPIVALRYE